MAQILVIEDNETMREGIAQILSRMGHDARTAGGGLKGVEMFEQSTPDFVITDLKMEDLDGMEVLRRIRQLSPEALVMVITAFGTIETAVEAMKLGAYDFITKPFSPEMLRLKVRSGLEYGKTREENVFLKAELEKDRPSFMAGGSKPMQNLLSQIARVAPSDSTVLITGESGTGKELVARALHAQSKRCDKPFIKVDCVALAEGVLESELFGHERGAFTGATHRKPGRFELADTGTIFLDEVGEIPPHVQTKLLRVLQDRSFERVGGTRTIRVDVRVLAATNKDLGEEVRAGRFREDLFYRLQVVPLCVPPLRERREDIPVLIDHFLAKHARKSGRRLEITPEAHLALKAHDWPGNIRELEHLIERLYVLTPGNVIDLPELPEGLNEAGNRESPQMPSNRLALNEALDRLEKQLILRAYEDAGRVKTKTAELLGIKTSALYYKLEKYGIHTKD
ncbi:MAG: sigma-54 dependent transcriptional regulator [Pseudomonadota bacterium]